MQRNKVVRLVPTLGLDILSQREVTRLRNAGEGGLKDLLRQCCLAVLNYGAPSDDAVTVLEEHRDFDVNVLQQDRGIKLELINAPEEAFVDGEIIRGIHEMLFDVLRDIVYIHSQIHEGQFDLESSDGITHAVFAILRHAGVLQARTDPNLVVCWGGHSISRSEYDYSKYVGYHLGLRGIDICTGCGPGAMKGPMKGASVAHRKQRIHPARYIGISEPGIIAAEAPNPIVNRLIIMPDIEKRLEAFVRFGHGIVVFPGGVGTVEEVLYLLGILLHPDNQDMPFPLVFTGPSKCAEYFEHIDDFIGSALGAAARRRYEIIIDNPTAVARRMSKGMEQVKEYRKDVKDAFFFNWSLTVEREFQQPFSPTHEAMSQLALHNDQEYHLLAANLRRAFSGIVSGNVKPEGIERIRRRGKFRINGDAGIMQRMDNLLTSFIAQQRMKLPGKDYVPCYELNLGDGESSAA